MILQEYLEIKPTYQTLQYYLDLGYVEAKIRHPLLVKNEDISEGSRIKEERICDCCGKHYIRKHRDNIVSIKAFGKDFCNDCAKKERMKRMKQTNLQKYGVEYIGQSAQLQEKASNTIQEKYNVKGTMQLPEIRKKAEETNLKKYGVKNVSQSKEIKQKILKSWERNGTAPSSKAQDKLFELCQKWFPEYSIKLNPPMSELSLDIELIKDNIKIDLEYDGWYWHHLTGQKDRARDEVSKTFGYKIIRIRSSTMLPTKEQLQECINYVLQDNHSFSQIYLQDWIDLEEKFQKTKTKIKEELIFL